MIISFQITDYFWDAERKAQQSAERHSYSSSQEQTQLLQRLPQIDRDQKAPWEQAPQNTDGLFLCAAPTPCCRKGFFRDGEGRETVEFKIFRTDTKHTALGKNPRKVWVGRDLSPTKTFSVLNPSPLKNTHEDWAKKVNEQLSLLHILVTRSPISFQRDPTFFLVFLYCYWSFSCCLWRLARFNSIRALAFLTWSLAAQTIPVPSPQATCPHFHPSRLPFWVWGCPGVPCSSMQASCCSCLTSPLLGCIADIPPPDVEPKFSNSWKIHTAQTEPQIPEGPATGKPQH